VASFAFSADGDWTTLATEQILAGAGFHKKVADSPAKLAHLKTLKPARKLVTHQREDQLYYVYADPETCKCMYVGTAAQYQLAIANRLERDQLEAMQEHLDNDTVIWILWAPWPWF
jgi:Mg/Co/Ni transporter MgtE